MADSLTPLGPGDRAPSFSLPAANREGTVALADLLPKGAVLVGLFRGLHCPFCRRQIFQLGAQQSALAELGVQPVAILNAQPGRARLYFRYHPTPVVLLADPEARTHRAFTVPSLPMTPEVVEALSTTRINPTGDLPAPLPVMEATEALNALDGFEMTDADRAIAQANPAQAVGHFLIDRGGIIRWVRFEAVHGLGDIGQLPTPAEILGAARSLEG